MLLSIIPMRKDLADLVVRNDPTQGGNPARISEAQRLPRLDGVTSGGSVHSGNLSVGLRVGRPKSALPIDADPAVIAVKKWLRDCVGTMLLTEVAAIANYSVAAVSTALGRDELPSRRLALAIAAAVGAPADATHDLWFAAALVRHKKQYPAQPDSPLAELATDLRVAMLRHDLGPTEVLRRMAKLAAAGAYGQRVMSRPTFQRLLAGETVPRLGQVHLLLTALEVSEQERAQIIGRCTVLEAAQAIIRSAASRERRAAKVAA
jgi:hypothetical protein